MCSKHKSWRGCGGHSSPLVSITHPEEPPNKTGLPTLPATSSAPRTTTTTTTRTTIATTSSLSTATTLTAIQSNPVGEEEQCSWHSRHTRHRRYHRRQHNHTQSVRRPFDFVYRNCYHPWMLQVFLVLTLFVFGNLSAWQENVRPKLYVELGKWYTHIQYVYIYIIVVKDNESVMHQQSDKCYVAFEQ